MTTPTPPTRPGWYPDPEGGPRQRYWDGSEWHTQAPSAKLAASREWAAQQRAEQELADTTRFAHIPPPAGSQQTSHWERDRRGKDGDNWTRSFEGTSRMVCGVEVGIVGTQRDDGRVTRRVITIHSGGADLKADTARQVAAALIEAADELDQLGLATWPSSLAVTVELCDMPTTRINAKYKSAQVRKHRIDETQAEAADTTKDYVDHPGGHRNSRR